MCVGSPSGLEVGDRGDSVGSIGIFDVGFKVSSPDVGFEVTSPDVGFVTDVGLEVVGRCPAAFHGVGCADVGFWGDDHRGDR